jgi:toxin ParE1/3/4
VSANVVRRASALHDLDAAADYIRIQSGPDRAIRFLREADATFARLAGMPGMGTRYDSEERLFADLRFFPIARHPKFLIFYRPITDGIEVVRVLHGARDMSGILAEEFGVGGDEDDPGG